MGSERADLLETSPTDDPRHPTYAVRAEADQQELLDFLLDTPNGREALRGCYPDIDRPVEMLVDEIERLALIASQGESVASTDDAASSIQHDGRASAATIAIWRLHKTVDAVATPHHYRPRTSLFRLARQGHEYLDSKVKAGRGRLFQFLFGGTRLETEKWRVVADIWGWSRNLLSFVAVVLVIMQMLSLATVVVAIRLALTLLCWKTISYPGDDSPDHAVLETDPRAALLSHATDMSLMFAVAMWILVGDADDQHALAGVAVGIASILMIMGTLVREVARVPRLHLERMMRGGSIVLSLAMLSWSNTIASGWLWLTGPLPGDWSGDHPFWTPFEWGAAGIVLGPVLFAAVEAMEAWSVMSSDDESRIAERIKGGIQLDSPGITTATSDEVTV